MKTNGEQGATQATTAVAQKEKTVALSLREFLESKRPSFQDLFPTKKQADRFMRILIALPVLNPEILQCDQKSILKAAILCARDGLEPDGRHAALVPFSDKEKPQKQAVYIAMVHGYIRKAFETGEFRTLSARSVYKNDEFSYQYDFDTEFRHVPSEGERGELRGVYAFYVLKSGGRDFIYMSEEACRAWGKKYAKSFARSDSLWQRDPEAAYLKTVLRRVLHFAPTSIEMPDDEAEGIRNVTPERPVIAPMEPPDIAPMAPTEPEPPLDAASQAGVSGAFDLDGKQE